MRYIEEVYGSLESSDPVIFGYDTVYAHKNVEKVETDSDGNPVENLYKYEEWQYTATEYLEIVSKKADEAKTTAGTVQEQMDALTSAFDTEVNANA